ncbi:MAG: hypothetical protein WC960_03540 [Bacteroidales bacterium]
MPFIDDIIDYTSLSVVGLEKNTGKTECLNYIIRQMSYKNREIAITSIGLDGEAEDFLVGSRKPKIRLNKGVLFTTGESHYRLRRVNSEIVEVGEEYTATGRLVTAKALSKGDIIISGPTTTSMLKRWVESVTESHSVNLAIVDGALSRSSHASPTVTQSMILTTGAALSLNLNEVVRKTLFALKLIGLAKSKRVLSTSLLEKERGVWLYSTVDKKELLLYPSAFNLTKESVEIEPNQIIFVTGALTDSLLKAIIEDRELAGKEIIVRDFTKIFLSPNIVQLFEREGGLLSVVESSRLVALCVNPVAPNGYSLNSNDLIEELSYSSNLPVYDIFKC